MAHKRQVSVHALELGVLILQLAEQCQVRDRHTRELTLLLVISRIADAMLSARVIEFGTSLNLFEAANYLHFAACGCLHVETLLAWEFSTSMNLRFSGGIQVCLHLLLCAASISVRC